jgi:hypothetical protein
VRIVVDELNDFLLKRLQLRRLADVFAFRDEADLLDEGDDVGRGDCV